MKATLRKTTIFTLSVMAFMALMADASHSFAQRSTSTSVNVRNNISVGGETGRGVPAIDQKIDLTDPVLDSKASGSVEIEEDHSIHPKNAKPAPSETTPAEPVSSKK